MATLDNMASDEEQIEEDLLIEALHQHLAYVEVWFIDLNAFIESIPSVDYFRLGCEKLEYRSSKTYVQE